MTNTRFDRVARVASGSAARQVKRLDLRYARVSQYNEQVAKLGELKKAFATLSKTISKELVKLPEGHEFVEGILDVRAVLEARMALLAPLQLPASRRVAGLASLEARSEQEAMKNFFNAALHHEVNNIFTPIVIYSELLAGDGQLPQGQKEAAGRIELAATAGGALARKFECDDKRIHTATVPDRKFEAVRYFAQHGVVTPFLVKRRSS